MYEDYWKCDLDCYYKYELKEAMRLVFEAKRIIIAFLN